MTKENYIMLKADDGRVLTNDVVYGKTILLGKGDKAENYREITDEEYWEMMAEDERDINIL